MRWRRKIHASSIQSLVVVSASRRFSLNSTQQLTDSIAVLVSRKQVVDQKGYLSVIDLCAIQCFVCDKFLNHRHYHYLHVDVNKCSCRVVIVFFSSFLPVFRSEQLNESGRINTWAHWPVNNWVNVAKTGPTYINSTYLHKTYIAKFCLVIVYYGHQILTSSGQFCHAYHTTVATVHPVSLMNVKQR